MTSTKGILNISSDSEKISVFACDDLGNFITSASAKFERKKVSEVINNVSKNIATTLEELGITNVDILIKGQGLVEVSAIQALRAYGMSIGEIIDITPPPRNDSYPRPSKRLRYRNDNSYPRQPKSLQYK